jgi:hypothetical protein
MHKTLSIVASIITCVCFAYFAAAFALFFVPPQYMPPTNWPFDEGARKAYKPFSGSAYIIR